MPLSPGTRIGPYEVISALGAGGMGEVFRARDTALNRDVALKTLPPMFAADLDRLARFEREAQALAALNHPHIAQVYAIERLPAEPGGAPGRAIVMEFVEGEDLSARISRGPVPMDEALAIARQIALALEAAHDAGIIHRDLKPANIKVRPDGTAKVLDFGLAKAVAGDAATSSSSLANSPTLTVRGTELGLVLGTAAYMAPEQAKGRAVDRRADVWAFGVVLYEMLTGRRAFTGDDVTEVIASVIRDTPDMRALPATTPPTVRRLLRRALEKDVRKRLRDMGDAGVELDEAMAPSDAEARTMPAAVGVGSRRGPWLAATIVVAALAGLAAWSLKPGPVVDRSVTRFSLLLADGIRLSGLTTPNLAWSPDGRRLAYRASSAIYVRDMDSVTPRLLLNASGSSQWFSPDGKTLLFNTAGALATIPLEGGPATQIHQIATQSGADWLDDRTIVYSDTTDLWRLPSVGGTPVALVTSDASTQAVLPQVLPGGRAILYTREARSGPGVAMMVKSLTPDEAPRVVLDGVGRARYVPSGHLIYGMESRLMAVPFDLERFQVSGSPVPLPETALIAASTFTQAVVAGNGALAYVSGGDSSRLQLSWSDGAGRSQEALPSLRNYSDVVLSPDGRRAAFHLWDEVNDVWVSDLVRGTLTRVTSSKEEEETPAWSPDGRELAYASTRDKRVIFRKAADGGASAPEVKVFESVEHTHVNGWTKNGELIVEINRKDTGNDLIAVDVKTGKARDVLASPFSEGWARLSPDGRWLAYVSNESGTNQVYVQPYPAMNARVQVSVAGGVEPVWARDGRRLYFRAESVMAAPLTSPAPLEFGAPAALFTDRFERTQGNMHTHYDVTADGRFLMVENPEAQRVSGRSEIHIVLNWVDELKRLAPVPGRR